MFLRPRCREWTPLATQQLRLRNLIQIVGYNIRPPETCTLQCSFYLTLHHTTMSAPFYTSERITSPHPKWKEIDSELTQCTSCANIVVRIWCHELQPSGSENTSQNPDTIIQTWGVYFSGLRYIGANLTLNFTSDCFKSNTLVFQMHGGYFCSYKSLKLDVIPPENEIEHGSLSSDSSGKTSNPASKPTIESKLIQNHRFLKESRSVSPNKLTTSEKEYSKSQSPVEKGFKQHFPSIRSSSSLNIAQNQRRKEESSDRKILNNHIYEHSPNDTDVREFSNNSPENLQLSNSKIDLSETAENYDLRNENDWSPKYRYLLLSFLKSEIRPSYNATKLQKLHLLQYSIKKRQEAVRDIKERIYKKSAMTNMFEVDELNEHKLKLKSKSQRNLFSQEDSDLLSDVSHSDALSKSKTNIDYKTQVSNGPRLTLKLNDLLSFNSKPSPFQRAEHYRLTKQLEILRFKRIILNDETDSKLANIRRLKERYSKLVEENQDVGTELMQYYHTLSRLNEALKDTKQSAAALRELAARSHKALVNRRAELLNDLQSIFHIDQKDEVTWSICGANLPVCESSPYNRVVTGVSVMSGMSAAAGLSAQCLAICAHISDIPLRYALKLRGSATIVIDIANHVPDNNIPLFARGGDVTLFRYGLFLLNKCIGQVMYSRGIHVSDMRPTLSNLKKIMTTPPNPGSAWRGGCGRAHSLRSLVPDGRHYGRQFNRFKDSVEGQSPHTLMSLQRHRHSRSVGSYQDDNELSMMDASTSSIMGSEPNIYQTNLATPSDNSNQPAENSDRELEKKEDKVIFTLGDDTELIGVCENEKLVRLSSNNNDEVCACLDDTVKQICTEINDYCELAEITLDSAENAVTMENSTGHNETIENFNENNATMEHSAKSNVIVEYLDAKNNDAKENFTENNVTMEDSAKSNLIVEDVEVKNNDAKGNSPENNVTLDISAEKNAIIDIEDSRTCENCESNVDGVCVDFKCAKNIDEEVIVIQSAEANLDTGQDSFNQT